MEAVSTAANRKVRASSTNVLELDIQGALSFVSSHHRQGTAQIGKRPLAYGIYLQEELLGVAIFCNPRTAGMQKRYTTELFRMAFKAGIRVYGGASKLIRTFLEQRDPADLFTYQDTSGEGTSVYEHAGMELVGPRNPKKKVLVKNGLIFAEATNNRSDWFSMEQAVRRGPDALIGTKLGERFRPDGKRLSNVELFIEHCGYHLEEVPGDRVYQWFNPRVSFYIYRLTSTVDSGYYIGRKSLWKANASEEDCILDGYLGSGGAKFQNWVAKVGQETLKKDILSIHTDWRSVLRAEANALGDLYRTDPNCKNKIAGGLGYAAGFPYPTLRECEVHGSSKHIGNSCISCSTLRAISIGLCETHGETKFSGESCSRCLAASRYEIKRCPSHGDTKFVSSGCLSCLVGKTVTLENCDTHGSTKFRSGRCARCSFEESTTLESCEHHGESIFHLGECLSCRADSALYEKDCAIHGPATHDASGCRKCRVQPLYTELNCDSHGSTIHRSGVCTNCIAEASHQKGNCDHHGATLFRGKKCCRCTSESSVNMGVCEIHGQTKFTGDRCRKCVNSNTLAVADCPEHGATQHMGDTCLKCSSSRAFSMGYCAIHGEVKLRGSQCARCTAKSAWSERECSIHGLSKFNGENCAKCLAASQLKVANCSVHGETEFKGKSCCRCTAEKTAHSRFHRNKIDENCRMCSERQARGVVPHG